MATYRTPGVYVDEISTLPPSVAEVSTAVPAFIGCTAIGPTPDNDKVVPTVARINTLLEYETNFGKAPPSSFEVKTRAVNGNDEPSEVEAVTRKKPTYEFLLYCSLSLYFKNGGGSCYVVSIGNYDKAPKVEHFKAGLDELEKEDEPTLILLTDAVNLDDSADYYALCRDALKQCKELKDRFTILDVLKSDGVKKFRNGEIGTDSLKYGAAYHPYLQTSLNRHYEPTSVTIMLNKGEYRTHTNGLLVTYDRPQTDNPQVKLTITNRKKIGIGFDISNGNKLLTIRLDTGGADVAEIVQEWGKREPEDNASFNIESSGDGSQKVTELVAETDLTYTSPDAKPGKFQTDENGLLVTYDGLQADKPKVKIEFNSAIGFDIQNKVLTITLPQPGADVAEIVEEWGNRDPEDNASFNIESSGDGSQKVIEKVDATALTYQLTLGDPVMKNEKTDLYNRIKTELDKQRVVLPPSAAVAGVYARVDRERGVWKAPANESLSAVIGPVSKITHADQERLNIDPTAGKSINAIRAFTGKGTLIWGARTLAGNDNEWRYVSVRRLFNMIEESTQKATSFAVFEPNDATTWLKVKGMIESYLYGLWERGALAGSTPEAAYFVNVGLGKTMTAQDVLEGRMIVEIGVAAVRPAEFIIIKFTHKLQEA